MLCKKLVVSVLIFLLVFMNAHLGATEPKILVVVTSYSGEITPGHFTGYWAEEFVLPCEIFLEKGFSLVVATPDGKTPVADPASLNEEMRISLESREIKDLLDSSLSLEIVDPTDFSGVFIVGGHGVLWDLVYNSDLDRIINQLIIDPTKFVAAVCHGPAALVNIKDSNGESVLKNRKVTGFSIEEELAVKLYNVVKISPLQGQLGTRLKVASNNNYSFRPNWQPYVVKDGNLITGQNPFSSKDVAIEIVKFLQGK